MLLVMSTATTNARMDAMESKMDAIMSLLTGGNKPSRVMPEVTRGSNTSKGKKGNKSVEVDPDVVTLAVNGRIKLPKRMFNSKGVTTVGGVKFRALDSDAGRSAPINADEMFDAPKGSTIEFTRSGKNEWDFEVFEATKPRSKDTTQQLFVSKPKTTSPSKPDFRSKRTKAQQAEWDAAPRHELTGNRKRDIANLLDVVSDQIVANAADPKFVKNANIEATDAKSTFKVKTNIDPRVWLTTPQHNRLKRARKALGLSTEQVVHMLNDMLELS